MAAAGRLVADRLYPPQCLSCSQPVAQAHGLCASCFRAIGFLEGPACAICGVPFDLPVPEGTLCAPCLRKPPPFGLARAVMRYDAGSRGLVLGFKHGDRLHATPAMARWMARTGQAALARADLVTPVPLHWTRLFWRRYNQAAELARGIANLAGVQYVPDLLVRRRATLSQGAMRHARARRLNVAGAFQVLPRHVPTLVGRRIVLVDDVFTTGATVGAASRALMRAGAAHVAVITLARVVRAGDGAL
jgi:ComF family protein